MHSCCGFERDADRQFTVEKAKDELGSYRNGRIGPTTRRLRDEVVRTRLNQGTLLDIGGGVGALTFELLDRGMTGAVVAEASAAYVAAAADEARRRGKGACTHVVHGDFLTVSGSLAPASLVTLDRVVCCYPYYAPLLEQALRLSTNGFALSYPHDRWYVRAVMWLDNARRARKSGFRTFVHSTTRIRDTIEQAGLRLVGRRTTLMWSIDVYSR
jgi:magnesium-protoporphyrin O-methyltransferase